MDGRKGDSGTVRSVKRSRERQKSTCKGVAGRNTTPLMDIRMKEQRRARMGKDGLEWERCPFLQEERAGVPVVVQQSMNPTSIHEEAAPVSQPLLTLRPTGLAVVDVAELLCEAQSSSLPVLYSFYFNGEMLGNRVAPCGRAASLLFRVTSERDAGNYSCEAENSVSKETSKPGALSLDGLQKGNFLRTHR